MEWQDRGALPTSKQQPKGNDNPFASLLPTGGGIAGSLAGAGLGTAILPGLGTIVGGLIGGIAGSAAGKYGENVAEGQQDVGKGVLEEALLGGLTSLPPIRLAKGAISLGKAVSAGAKAGEALTGRAAKDAFTQGLNAPGVLNKMGATLRGEARGIDVGSKVSGQQLTPQKVKELNAFLETTIKPRGTTAAKQLEDVGAFIETRNNDIANAIGQNTRALTNAEKSAIIKRIDESFNSKIISPTTRQKQLLEDYKTNIRQSGDTRSLYDTKRAADTGINYARNIASPNPKEEQVLKIIRTEVNGGIVSKVPETSAINRDISRAHQVEDLLLNKASGGRGFARANSSGGFILPIPLRAAQSAQSIGGRILGRTGREAIGTGAEQQTNRVFRQNLMPTAGIVGRESIGRLPTLFSSAAGDMTTGTDMATGTDMGMEQPQDVSSSFGISGGLTDQGMGADVGQMGQMGQQSPYSQANLLFDINQDPQNASKYIQLYQSLQDVFGSQQPKLNTTQIQQANNANSALTDIQSVANSILQDPSIIQRNELSPGSVARNLTGTTDYQAAKQNIVDVIGRLRSGAALTADEEKRYLSLLPQIGDSQESAISKLLRLNSLLQSFANPQSAQPDLTTAIMQTQGGF